MALVLAITDRGDGTGVDATVVSVGGADVVTLHRQLIAGTVGAGAWVESGSRTGNGVIAVTVAPGFYLWYVATATAVSPVVTRSATDAATAIYHRVLDAVVARLALVSLPGITAVTRNRNPPLADPLLFPCLSVTAYQMVGEEQKGTLMRDYIWYPAEVTILDSRPYEDDDGSLLLWRERIGRAFRRQKLPGVPEVITCRVEPGLTLEQSPDPESLLEKSVLMLWFMADEPRGIAA